MPDHPMPEPTTSTLQGSSSGAESDLGELASLFSAHGGGNFSAEVSAQLALEIVLNEIVEQACLATGATGAAIVLVRDGEMVCRASSGANAPVLGSPLGSESGLTAECINSRKVQRCDDAQDDPRADAEASRSLGVRSVMILPLLRKDELAGVLEVFSSRPAAFGDRDELTLEALAQRILKNLERASEPLSLISKAASLSSDTGAGVAAQNLPVRPIAPPIAPMMPAEPENLGARSAKSLWEEADVLREIAGRGARGRFDFAGLALVVAVLVCAVLLGTLMGVRMGWRRGAAVRAHVTRSASGASVRERNSAQRTLAQNTTPQNLTAQTIPAQNIPPQNMPAQNGVTQAGGEPGRNAGSASASSGAGNGNTGESGKNGASAPQGTPAAGSKDSFPPPGSLVVYDNGKEIFRLPPTVEGDAAGATRTSESGAQSAAPGEVRRASAVEPAGIVKLDPQVARGRLVHRVEPDYPEEARKQGIHGAVVLEVHIGRDGAIQDVKVVSGQVLLANAAIAAVKQWRFKPHMVQGQPVEMQTRVTLNFRSPG
jgi:TonB family protein